MFDNFAGSYLLLESTDAKEGDEGYLVTSTFIKGQDSRMCLAFMYNMKGKEIGELEFSIWPVKSPNKKEVLWRLAGNQGL